MCRNSSASAKYHQYNKKDYKKYQSLSNKKNKKTNNNRVVNNAGIFQKKKGWLSIEKNITK